MLQNIRNMHAFVLFYVYNCNSCGYFQQTVSSNNNKRNEQNCICLVFHFCSRTFLFENYKILFSVLIDSCLYKIKNISKRLKWEYFLQHVVNIYNLSKLKYLG